jgi:phosphoglucosamine mutase
MKEYPQRLINLPVREKRPLESLPAFQDALRAAEAQLGANGRVLVRYSGTENKVRVLVETEEEAEANRHATTLAGVLQKEIGA